MCGRYTLTAKQSDLISHFSLKTHFAYRSRFNIAPAQMIPVIKTTGNLDFQKWGMIAHWQDEQTTGFINARSETAAQKPVFKKAFFKQRCLIPADGYVEWKAVGKKKQPVYFTLPKHALFAFAGIWDQHPSIDGAPLESCAILTLPAKQHPSIHHRMPVIVPQEHYHDWLNPKIEPLNLLKKVSDKTHELEIKATSISTLINSPKNDLADCLSPL